MLAAARRPVTLVLLLLGGTVLAFLLARLPPVVAVEQLTRDLRIARLLPPRPQDERIVVLAIGETTLAAFPYRSPINRGLLTRVLATLDERHAAAIGLDVLLDQPTEPVLDAALAARLHAMTVPTVLVHAGPGTPMTEAQRAWHEAFTAGLAAGDGTLLSDPIDDVVRRQRPTGRARPSFPGAVAAALGRPLPAGTFPIDYRRGPDPATPPFRIYPAEAVALLPPAWLAGKIVLVGPILEAIDRHPTPLSRGTAGEGTPGVLIHAQALAQLMDGGRLPIPGVAAGLAMLGLAGALGLGLVLLSLGWPARLALGILLLGGWWAGAFWLASRGAGLWPVVGPTLALGLTSFAGTAWLERRERSQRRFIRKAFEQYRAPSMVRRLARDPAALRLGGERREITCLFTDLAGFTTLSEQLPPERLVAVLTAYMEGVLALVLEHEGTIDKLIGDAVHAFWNAPENQPDHARRALLTALAIDRFAEAFRAEQHALGIPLGVTRIGVHSGPAVVGNFGGRQRVDYTPMGDVVNTAARLESVNKQLGTRICVGEAVALACPDIATRPVGDLVLVGKTQPLATRTPGADPAYEAAYALLARGDPAAAAAFEPLAPGDPLAAFHLERLRRGESGARVVLEHK
jgi:class 3 adenylate cyclase/CHASE2 domain-containing sensor protein